MIFFYLMDFYWDVQNTTIRGNDVLKITKLYHFINNFENKYVRDPNSIMPREFQSSDVVPICWCPCQSGIFPFVGIPGL